MHVHIGKIVMKIWHPADFGCMLAQLGLPSGMI